MNKIDIHHLRNLSNQQISDDPGQTKSSRVIAHIRRFSNDEARLASNQGLLKTHSKFGRGISYDKSVLSKDVKNKTMLPVITNNTQNSAQKKNITTIRKNLINTNNDIINEQGRTMKRNNSERKMIKMLNRTKFDFNIKNSINQSVNQVEEEGPYKKRRQISFAMNSNNSFFTNIMKKKIAGNENEADNSISPYAIKKKNPKSSASVFNASKIKLLHRNISASNIAGETNKTPVKIKERNNEEDLVKAYKFKSQAGKSEGNITKTNQDSYLVFYEINGVKNFHMFGVLDGHGYNGHLASAFVTNYIKNTIAEHPEIRKLTDVLEIYHKLKEDNYNIIKQTYIKAEKELTHAEFDCNFSGTTCVIVFQIGHRLICANTGDSRAVLVTKMANKPEAIPLSKDHKPNIDREKKRIIKSKGRVEQFCEFGIKNGPYRVWLKNEMYPGLAMSRSIGDLIASSVGVIPEPEIIEYFVNSNTRYITIASDGVWEFLSNEAVMKIANKYYESNDPIGLCDAVVAEATRWWEKEDVVIDDITIVTIFY